MAPWRAPFARRPARTGQRGFTLLEVLIAVLILSIGLLGLAGLQAFSLQNSQSSAVSSQASHLAYDALDRMRANRSNADAYEIGMADGAPGGNSTAARDLRQWKSNIDALLPGAAGDDDLGGSISVDGNNRVTITLSWSDARWDEDNPDETRTFNLSTRL